MSCKNVCRLCDRLIISEAVTFAAGTLTVNLPAGSYADGCKYCIVVAQTIPAATTITAPVVITIGDGTVEYPLVDRCCAQVTACAPADSHEIFYYCGYRCSRRNFQALGSRLLRSQ